MLRKTWIVLFLMALFLTRPASTQISSNVDAEHVVRAILESPKPGITYTGLEEKQLSRMGDSAAVAVTKVLSGKQVSSRDVDRVLLVIRLAFSAPELIQSPVDREPRTSLFILKALEGSASEAQLKSIAATSFFLHSQAQEGLPKRDEKQK